MTVHYKLNKRTNTNNLWGRFCCSSCFACDHPEPSLHVPRGSASVSFVKTSWTEFGRWIWQLSDCESLAGANVSLSACLLCLLSMAGWWKLQAGSAPVVFFNVLQLVSCADATGCSRCGADRTHARVFCGAIRQREFRKYQAGIMRSGGVCFLSPLVSTQALTLCYWDKAEFESLLSLE